MRAKSWRSLVEANIIMIAEYNETKVYGIMFLSEMYEE